MKIRFQILFLPLLISACLPAQTASPTPLPEGYISTLVALTGQVTFATASASVPLATATLTPTNLPRDVTATATMMPTLAPGFNEFAQIRFLSPGPLSSLTSPIDLQAILFAGQRGIVRIELLGGRGRILYRRLEVVPQDPKNGAYYRVILPFEIRAASENGLIRISTNNENNRIQALNTLPVLLNRDGETRITPPGDVIYERISYDGLREKDEISGGVVRLAGRFLQNGDQPLFVELATATGSILSSRILHLDGTGLQPFETNLPYTVLEPTKAWLSVHQDDPNLPVDPDLGQLVYLNTMELTLLP